MTYDSNWLRETTGCALLNGDIAKFGWNNGHFYVKIHIACDIAIFMLTGDYLIIYIEESFFFY